jgi:hypothetical protein
MMKQFQTANQWLAFKEVIYLSTKDPVRKVKYKKCLCAMIVILRASGPIHGPIRH